MTTAPNENAEFLSSLGLNPNAPKLSAVMVDSEPAKVPTGVQIPENAHTMPVTDIVFDDALLAPYGDLTGDQMGAASRAVFALYKSPGRDKDRNSLLHRRISEWIASVKRERRTGGMVREIVKTTAEQRDIAQVLAAKGMSAADLVALIQALPEKEA